MATKKMPSTKALTKRPRAKKLTIVGLGASAGGLAPLQRFFHNVPRESSMAYVVVVHLSPQYESHLADLLQSHTELPVQQVQEVLEIEANHVYVIPPGRNLSAIDTHLRVAPLEAQRLKRAPIDHFFRSLAENHSEKAVAVILSGTGSDGAVGLKLVKEKGGLTVAQDPAEADYDGMPQSAIATGQVDLVLKAADIPARLLEYVSSEPKLPAPPDGEEPATGEREVLQKILTQVRVQTTHDFSRYKPSTVTRRIRRRMQLHHITDPQSYLELLRGDKTEVEALASELLITVTNFFRDPEAFAALEQEVIPKLFEGKGPGDQVRVWSVGCATGEEAYSLAMLLLEQAHRLENPPGIQVFASDVHAGALAVAREGFYPGAIAADVSEGRLKRFFREEPGHGYRVSKELRESVLFAFHNVLADPPFSKLDLITCRNLLIYLQRDMQQEVIKLFRYALSPSGYLFLGSSESLENTEAFHPVNKKHYLYQRRNVGPAEPWFPKLPLQQQERPFPAATPNETFSYGALHARLAERYAPPSILVNKEHAIIHLSAHAGQYLHQPGGEPTNDIFQRIRGDLRSELRSVLYGAFESGEVTVSRPVQLPGEKSHEIVLQARPAEEPELEGFVLIIFDEHPPLGEAEAEQTEGPLVQRLENQLTSTRQRLRTVIEEYETSREEMKASNEELVSMNEELRSTAEELETSREELQSMNEELITLNQENRHKIEELSGLNNDLQNLFTATDIATIFLDRQLTIKRFTPQVTRLFNILASDQSRPLAHLTHKLGDESVSQDAAKVLETLTPISREVKSEEGSWYLMRLLPYRTAEDRIDGVVITFVDVTKAKKAEMHLQEAKDDLDIALEGGDMGTWNLDTASGDIQRNLRHDQIFGYEEARENWSLETAAEHVLDEDRQRFRESFQEALSEGELHLEVRVRWPDESVHWVRLVGRTSYSPDHRPLRLSGVVTDISEQKHAEEERSRLLGQLEREHLHLQELNTVLEAQAEERTRQFSTLQERFQQSEERFRRAFEAEPVATCLTSLEGDRFLDVNRAFTRLTGYTREEVVGKTSRELEMWASAEDQQKLRAAEGSELELTIRTKENRLRTVLCSSEVIGVDDHSTRLRLFYDISERKETREQLLNAIQDVMRDADWFGQTVLDRLAQIRSNKPQSASLAELSKRECEVLSRLARNQSNEEIAEELGIAVNTVRNYIANVYSKLDLHSRAEAVLWARERGLGE